MTESLVALTVALIAWLLGLLTPQIVERIARRYHRPELMKSIALELDEVRFKLLTVCHAIRSSKGMLDRDFLEWAGTRAKNYQGVQAKTPTRQHLIDQASYTDEQIANYNAASKRPDDMTAVPQKIALPFLTSQLGSMSILAAHIQRQLMEVLSRVDYFNASVDKIRESVMLTFDAGLDKGNRAIVQGNLVRSLQTLDMVATQIAELADSLIPAMDPSHCA